MVQLLTVDYLYFVFSDEKQFLFIDDTMNLLSGDVVASQPIVGLDQAFGRRRRSSEENKK